MIKWKMIKDENKARVNTNKIEYITDILRMKRHLETVKDFKDWLDRLEDINGEDYTNNNIFNPIALALIRRTFPALFANQIVSVQPMKELAYALRFVNEED